MSIKTCLIIAFQIGVLGHQSDEVFYQNKNSFKLFDIELYIKNYAETLSWSSKQIMQI